MPHSRNLDIVFREMDAQALSYAEESFDVVLSRNLTWTLPEPEKAYREWFRVLKSGGWLLNFDADYAANVRSHSMQNCKVAPDSPYGHIGMTDALQQENDEITLTMDIGQLRPAWDMRVLRRIGFSDCPVRCNSRAANPWSVGFDARADVRHLGKESITLHERG